jgi:NADH-quinone oxidoreductase subunit D
MPGYIDELEALFSGNEIVLARARNVGVVSDSQAIDASFTGPMLRASSVQWDLRKADPYEVYDRMEFDVPIGATGDVFDRYLVRIQEMRESVKIITQCIEQVPGGPVKAKVPFNVRPPRGDAYAAVEAPKGELGFYLVSDGGISPYRCKIRSPSFINLTLLREMLVGWKMGDLVVILGSVDIVMGEVDR